VWVQVPPCPPVMYESLIVVVTHLPPKQTTGVRFLDDSPSAISVSSKGQDKSLSRIRCWVQVPQLIPCSFSRLWRPVRVTPGFIICAAAHDDPAVRFPETTPIVISVTACIAGLIFDISSVIK
jgi:hypothetical protein